MFKKILNLSRPRFWIYVFGPYLLGITAARFWENETSLLTLFLFGIFFLFPANIFIYGVNDIFDSDTDALNEKKNGYEIAPQKHEKKYLVLTIFFSLLPFLLLSILSEKSFSLPLFFLASFLFFSFFYSAPPLRAKAIPFVDSWFNILYIFPGFFGYVLSGGEHFSFLLFAAAWCWCIAMHAYSAVPDIAADKAAGIATTATFLQKNKTLWYCFFFYFLSSIFFFLHSGIFAFLLLIPYLFMIFASWRADTSQKLFRLYTFFPLINTLVGMLLFFFIYFF
jgi:4-hydroxybenzoate polyprenyltransferase